MKILGISAFYHDSAAALVIDGEIVAAAQEERFSRKKHDPRFPINAVNYCLEEAFIEVDDLDLIVFYDNPVLTLDRVLKTLFSTREKNINQWHKIARSVMGVKVFITDLIQKELRTNKKIYFTEHHFAHAASAFYPSPFNGAAILTIDGVGEWATTTIGIGNESRIKILKEIKFPHSLGLLYSSFTYFCGFKVNSGEYKLMGLAPYGKPVYSDLIKEKLIHIQDDGSYQMNMEYFGYLDSDKMINSKFEELFGGPARVPESQITRREMDLAASVQSVTEEIILKLAKYAKEVTNQDNIVLAGGVALNCVANGKLLNKKIFDKLWIQPAAGDAGGALGAALLAYYYKSNDPRILPVNGRDLQNGSYLGPKYSNSEIEAFLDKGGYPYKYCVDKDERNKLIAEVLAEEKIVGYFSGRMEYGPRALGNRSILGNPCSSETQVNMNLKIKYRESFRPFAPSVMYDKSSEYFELYEESPYMLLVAPVKESRREKMPDELKKEENLLNVVKFSRSDIPAVTHVDYSARVQTVHPEDNNDYYDVIKTFKEKTGYGLVVNTSFNVRGEPIVCTPKDAYLCFMRTEIDVLVLQDYILYKKDQPELENDTDWRKQYELD